jgi:catechol 2,3-dioxygenase-like lactoylglutathione lyase family enzyme
MPLNPIARKGEAMNKSNPSVTGIVEISQRVHDLDLMRRFYEQVLGLQVLRENKNSAGTVIVVFYFDISDQDPSCPTQ